MVLKGTTEPAEDGSFVGELGEIYVELGDELGLQITLPESLVPMGFANTILIESWHAEDANAGISLRPASDDPSNLSSPLVLDLDGDSLELIELGRSGAFFDIDRDGFAERMGWVAPDSLLGSGLPNAAVEIAATLV